MRRFIHCACWFFLAAGAAGSLSLVRAAEAASAWPAVTLPSAAEVKWSGAVAAALDRGVARLAKSPYTAPWLLADVSFGVNRIFTNYSGDVSGRFLELAALTSPPGQRRPATLGPVLAAVPRYQKADGHFGVDVDLSKPLTKDSAPIPMLWGNGRILVGLVTCAETYHDPQALAAAKKLGDFYVHTAGQLCSPAREAEYRASGTYGDSYTCCYFPAIEGLAMLYRATKDERYLKQAERMAEFFRKFDALPIDHSHGNLSAWRGILRLYEITGKREYLDRARAKWDAATSGGFVWPIGGVGEHWYVSFPVDEGCSESDWLRFCLDLWRFTGQTRYLDVAERLLCNQYLANQSPNGGFGARHFDCDATGPVGTRGNVEEWPWCCSFHGPLGLYFLKSYLAAGSNRGVLVNFPLNFDAPVRTAGQNWRVRVHSGSDAVHQQERMEIELSLECGNRSPLSVSPGNAGAHRRREKETGDQSPHCSENEGRKRHSLPLPETGVTFGERDAAMTSTQRLALNRTLFSLFRVPPSGMNDSKAHTTLWVRMPGWAASVKEATLAGRPIAPVVEHGYLRVEADFRTGEKLAVTFQAPLTVEGRRFQAARIPTDRISRLREVAILLGPHVLAAAPAPNAGRPVLLATIDPSAGLRLLDSGPKGFATVALPSLEANSAQIAAAVASARPVLLRPLVAMTKTTKRRSALVSDLVVVPAASVPAKDLAQWKNRAKTAQTALTQPIFGDDLEKRPEAWIGSSGWQFTPEGLRVTGGDVGLIDGEGYGDYRFEFDLVLPREGQGITGWVVRATSEADCLMFQLQSADSPFRAPEFKTRPNTLRPHVRRNGQWTIADPVPLPKQVLRGENHHVAVECRGENVTVFLDGQKIYSQRVRGRKTGTVGFRAGGPGEQGVFRHISLKK